MGGGIVNVLQTTELKIFIFNSKKRVWTDAFIIPRLCTAKPQHGRQDQSGKCPCADTNTKGISLYHWIFQPYCQTCIATAKTTGNLDRFASGHVQPSNSDAQEAQTVGKGQSAQLEYVGHISEVSGASFTSLAKSSRVSRHRGETLYCPAWKTAFTQSQYQIKTFQGL